jgi:glycosyltransferase involved in cell wall biosynthesis
MFIVSIITVVYNGCSTIEETIISVISQKVSEIEYIIVDGSSTDGTLEIINRYKNSIDLTISEPDDGIYDAMNKGIALASGKYICFINAGDTLIEIPLKQLKNENADMFCFPIYTNAGAVRYPNITWLFKLTNTLPHQGIFYKRQSSLKYDIKYKVFADYALNADYMINKRDIKSFNQPVVANHFLDGVSNNRKSSGELFRMIKDKFGFFHVIISFMYFKLRGVYHRLHLLCF